MNIQRPTAPLGRFDGIYDDLLDAFRGLSVEEQRQLTAALLICLCHRIADPKEIKAAIAEARASLRQSVSH